MGEPFPEQVGHLEPGGAGHEVVRTIYDAAVKLAELLESVSWDTAQIDRLNERLGALDEKLDRTNELLHNMIKVLDSRGSDV